VFDDDEAAEFVEPTRGQVRLMFDKVLDPPASAVRPKSGATVGSQGPQP
jgi:hypothetical protein